VVLYNGPRVKYYRNLVWSRFRRYFLRCLVRSIIVTLSRVRVPMPWDQNPNTIIRVKCYCLAPHLFWNPLLVAFTWMFISRRRRISGASIYWSFPAIGLGLGSLNVLLPWCAYLRCLDASVGFFVTRFRHVPSFLGLLQVSPLGSFRSWLLSVRPWVFHSTIVIVKSRFHRWNIPNTSENALWRGIVFLISSRAW
jgi:hypothetical protein